MASSDAGVSERARTQLPQFASPATLRRRISDAGPRTVLRDGGARLSCVIPCWNEISNLVVLLPLLTRVLAALAGEWEIIIVDDGSTDNTVEALRDWWMRGSGVRLIELSRNFGKEAALTAGLRAAEGDAVILMDADLQHPPELLSLLVSHWRHGADMVYTVRANRDDEPRLKRWGAAWFYRLVNASRFKVPPAAGDFRLMDRAVVDALLALPERNRFMKGLYAWVGFNSVGVPYEPPPRATGKSHFSLLRLLKLSMDGLTAFTTWPLRAVSVAGVLVALSGLCYGAYLTIEYLLNGNEVSGWTTIVVGLFLFSGVQLISLGVLGEYIGRVFEEVKARPLFVVKGDLGRGLTRRQA
jgi:glycosyltransferase involved in cell wall biosynthesis